MSEKSRVRYRKPSPFRRALANAIKSKSAIPRADLWEYQLQECELMRAVGVGAGIARTEVAAFKERFGDVRPSIQAAVRRRGLLLRFISHHLSAAALYEAMPKQHRKQHVNGCTGHKTKFASFHGLSTAGLRLWRRRLKTLKRHLAKKPK
jgi:hypothetical protein